MIAQTTPITQATQSKSTHASNFGNRRGRKTVSPETHAKNIAHSIRQRILVGQRKIDISQYTKCDDIQRLVHGMLSEAERALSGLGNDLNEVILREQCNRMWDKATEKPDVPAWVGGLMQALRNAHRMTPEGL